MLIKARSLSVFIMIVNPNNAVLGTLMGRYIECILQIFAFYLNPFNNADVRDAVSDGNAYLVRRLLHCGLDVNDTSGPVHERRTALFHAFLNGKTEICKLLLKRGAHVGPDTETLRPLHRAVLVGDVELCSMLISLGVKIDEVDEDGNQVLHLACMQGDIGSAKLLLFRGAGEAVTNSRGQTPLHLAAGLQEESWRLCQLLLEHGAKPDSVDSAGCQPVHLAWKQKHMETCIILLSSGVDVNRMINKRQQTMLHEVASGEFGSFKLCKTLLELGAKVDSVDEDGNQSLHLAFRRGLIETGKLLLSHGADGCALNNSGESVIHILAQSPVDSPVLCLNLIERGASADVRNQYQKLPCQLALECGNPSSFHVLMTHSRMISSADRNDRDRIAFLNSLFLVAVKMGEAAICDLLLNEGASVDKIVENGRTALQIALDGNNEEITRVILAHGPRSTKVRISGRSAQGKFKTSSRRKLASLVNAAGESTTNQ